MHLPKLLLAVLASTLPLAAACGQVDSDLGHDTSTEAGVTSHDGGAGSDGATEGGGSSNDAGGTDAGHDASSSGISPSTPNLIYCNDGNPPCQSPTPRCCGAAYNGNGTCAPDNATCSSNLGLGCDGPEDCAGGVCCAYPPSGGIWSSCKTACDTPTDTWQLCHDHSQCPGSAPNCCPLKIQGLAYTFGSCDTRTSVVAGACDTP